MVELLTEDIAHIYRDKAKALPYNGKQDIGERRRLRQELQSRCGVTELEAVNILNGFYIDTYCIKYLSKEKETSAKEAKTIAEPRKKKKQRRQYLT
jgi:hypothetical protein